MDRHERGRGRPAYPQNETEDEPRLPATGDPVEARRLLALKHYRILDTPPEEVFERLSRAARNLIGGSAAFMTLIGENRQWIKTTVGEEWQNLDRTLAFCNHVVNTSGPLVVTDAASDARFENHPLVTDEPCIRFYVGVPLLTEEGHALGSLCVVDTRAHPEPTGEQMSALTDLAGAVVAAMRYRAGALLDRERLEARETLIAGQYRLLNLVASGTPLQEVLRELCLFIERLAPHIRTSVLLTDEEGTRLVHGAAPSLPSEFTRAIDGLPVGPKAGSCGTAAFRREFVEVADIASNPLWEEYREVALAHGLRASWSMPIVREDGRVLGTFALYYGEPRLPTPDKVELIRAAADLAAIAISHEQATAAQQRSASQYKALARFGQEIENINDFSGLVGKGLRSLLGQLRVDAAAFVEFRPEGPQVTMVEGAISSEMRRVLDSPAPLSTSLLEQIVQTGEPRLIRDYRSYEWATPRALRLGIGGVLALPVHHGGRVAHVVLLATLGRKAMLDESDTSIGLSFVRRLENALERAEFLNEVQATREATFRALGLALEHRDVETKGHTDRVVALADSFCDRLGLDERLTQAVRWGAYLHDIGKIGIRDSILLKPTRLDPEEFRVIQQHPIIGMQMCRDVPFLPGATCSVIRHHHERWDGSGYPDGLTGDAIPLEARLFAIVDVYDALISERPYKPAWSHEDAVKEVLGGAGRQFDDYLTRVFAGLVEELRAAPVR